MKRLLRMLWRLPHRRCDAQLAGERRNRYAWRLHALSLEAWLDSKPGGRMGWIKDYVDWYFQERARLYAQRIKENEDGIRMEQDAGGGVPRGRAR